MTYEIQKHDYIKFQRIVVPQKKKRIRDSFGGNHDIVESDRYVYPCSGSGYVLFVSKSTLSINNPFDPDGPNDKVRTARVDAGPLLGTVTAVIDDAVLIGKQTTMDLGYTVKDEMGGMYHQDAKGGA